MIQIGFSLRAEEKKVETFHVNMWRRLERISGDKNLLCCVR